MGIAVAGCATLAVPSLSRMAMSNNYVDSPTRATMPDSDPIQHVDRLDMTDELLGCSSHAFLVSANPICSLISSSVQTTSDRS